MEPVGKEPSAVEADSGLDAEAVVQRKGDVGKVAARRLDGDDARAALYAGEAKQFDTFSRAERREAREETLCERQFMRADDVQPGVRKETECGVKPGDAGEIHRSGLEAVWQEVRHEFGMAEAAGAARDQRRQLGGKIFTEGEAADALRAEQTLVAGKGEGVDVHGFHIDGENAGGLRAVDKEAEAVFLTKRADGGDGQERPADVACVRHDDEAGIWLQKARHGLKDQRAVRAAGHAGERDALCLELPERAHDGVVLHRRDEHMVARTEEALEQNIEALGDIFGEADAFAVRCAEEGGEAFARGEDEILCRVGRAIAAAGDVDAAVGQIAGDGLHHGGRLWKCGAGIVEIDGHCAPSTE